MKKGGIMWVARDKDSTINISYSKPTKGQTLWIPDDGILIELPIDMFPQVKWEDEEPTEVELIIKQK